MASSSKTPQQAGKDFEEEFRIWQKELLNHHRCAVHRFYDTHSTGGTAYLPDQPGDFLLVVKGQTHLWEVKSSWVHDSLSSCLTDNLSKEQAAHLRVWHRAGATTHVLFFSQQDKGIELWNGAHVGETRVLRYGRLRRGDCIRYRSFDQFKALFTAELKINSRYGAPRPAKEPA